MRKKIIYRVTGVSDSEPKNLPEGFKVEKLETQGAETLEIRSLHFADSAMYDNGVYIAQDWTSLKGRHLTRDETRQVRDFLNLVLGDSGHQMRVVKDQDGDVWFELEPDQFTLGGHHSNPHALELAERRKATGSAFRSKFLGSLMEHNYLGPVEFVENIWE